MILGSVRTWQWAITSREDTWGRYTCVIREIDETLYGENGVELGGVITGMAKRMCQKRAVPQSSLSNLK